MEGCPGCGFRYELELAEGVGGEIVSGVGRLASLLADPASDAGRRREPGTWSPLEYGAHVRDVLINQRERLLLARRDDEPAVVPMGRDERVEHDGYADQAPHDVAVQLVEMARLFAHALGRLDASAWERTLVYNWPAEETRSLRWLAVHTHHEVVHHLADVDRQLHVPPAVASTSATFEAVHPVLAVRDVAASVEWYSTRLGFTPLFVDDADGPTYAGLRRGGVEIHLQWHGPDEWSAGLHASAYRFLIDDPDAFFAEVEPRAVLPGGKQVEDTGWGTREFGLYDPDGNALFFYRDLP